MIRTATAIQMITHTAMRPPSAEESCSCEGIYTRSVSMAIASTTGASGTASPASTTSAPGIAGSVGFVVSLISPAAPGTSLANYLYSSGSSGRVTSVPGITEIQEKDPPVLSLKFYTHAVSFSMKPSPVKCSLAVHP